MNLKTWEQLSALKSSLLNLANVLVTDQVTPKETIAWDLIKQVKTVNELEVSFNQSASKGFHLLNEMVDKPSASINHEERSQISFRQWEVISVLKSSIINAVNKLTEDPAVAREEIAIQIMCEVYSIVELEKILIGHLEKTEFPRIDQLCDNAELAMQG